MNQSYKEHEWKFSSAATFQALVRWKEAFSTITLLNDFSVNVGHVGGVGV